ncbi:MAG: hypothetical protein AAF623_21785, partial [Planctomycetota bacterium]
MKLWIAVIALSFLLGGSSLAQKFDLESYLRKMDANQDGRLESSEMGNRTKDYIKKLGLDSSKPISIGAILKKSKKYEKDKDDNSKNKKKNELKVPQFGVEEA